MFLDDTACNLASLNLMSFYDAEAERFDVDGFVHACEIVITAQEILVDNAGYPRPEIAENSHVYRPLGLGFANLGALLMARGLPYDSEAGRDYAAAISALMSGAAYAQSARMAATRGPFPGFAKNRRPMLRVMKMHRDALQHVDAVHVPLETLIAKFAHSRFEPSGFTNNPKIPIAKSISDSIFRWLVSKFPSLEKQRELGIVLREPPEKGIGVTATSQLQTDSPSFQDCGSIMVRNGTCYHCPNFSGTSGCGCG